MNVIGNEFHSGLKFQLVLSEKVALTCKELETDSKIGIPNLDPEKIKQPKNSL